MAFRFSCSINSLLLACLAGFRLVSPNNHMSQFLKILPSLHTHAHACTHAHTRTLTHWVCFSGKHRLIIQGLIGQPIPQAKSIPVIKTCRVAGRISRGTKNFLKAQALVCRSETSGTSGLLRAQFPLILPLSLASLLIIQIKIPIFHFSLLRRLCPSSKMKSSVKGKAWL